MTKDLAVMSSLPDIHITNTDQFLAEVKARLERN